MFLNIAIAAVMLVVTTAIHAAAMLLALQQVKPGEAYSSHRLVRVSRISSIVILMFIAALLEVLVYAFTYLSLNAIEGL